MFLGLLIYFATVSLLSLFVKKRVAKVLVIVGLVSAVVVDGLRLETGTDWLPYLDHFNEIGNTPGNHFEIGYEFLTFISKSLFESYSFFLIIHAIAVYFGIYYTVFYLSGYKPIAVVLLYASLYAVLGSNRQLLALVFFVLSIRFLIDRQLLIFSLLIACGALFHLTILLIWPLYFLFGINIRSVFIAISTLFIAGFMIAQRLDSIVEILVYDNIVDLSRYIYYTSEEIGETRPTLALAKKIFAIAIPIILAGPRAYRSKNKFFLFTAICSFLTVPLYIIGELGLPIFNSRFDIYFGYTFYPIFAAQILQMSKRFDTRLALTLFFLLVAIINFFQNPMYDLFSPYKSIFYNTDLIRNLY